MPKTSNFGELFMPQNSTNSRQYGWVKARDAIYRVFAISGVSSKNLIRTVLKQQVENLSY
ncbi:MAG: hypothetical protein V7K97_23565 [Nostoc sp.]|uniref:hypothetical protein n=1 Tax=Nostoc sp. TaxID=1180 RepID=UPI002FFA0CF2